VKYRTLISRRAGEGLRSVRDRREQRKVYRRALALEDEPLKQGKPLTGTLRGYRSVRAGQRHRILYTVDEGNRVVIVALIGTRKEGDRGDVYRIAERLSRLGLLSP